MTALTAPAWSQANIRPDPDPRVPTQPGQALPREDALFLKEAAAASQGQAELGRLAAEKAPDDEVRTLAGRIAETGVDFISVGRITQSAPAVDIGLDFALIA